MSPLWTPPPPPPAVVRPAQESESTTRRVEARVQDAVGVLITLDRGLASGIRAGDVAWILRPGGAPAEAEVVEVGEDDCRVRLVDVDAEVLAGAPAEVTVPLARLRALGLDESTRPDHAPWEAGEVEWDEERPLLAPLAGTPAADREPRLRTRLYSSFDWWNDTGGVDRTYTSAWLGADVRSTNPFGKGGEARLRLEGFSRTADVEGRGTDDEGRLRFEQASYLVGGRRGQPARIELGRFVQREFPEFGRLDGTELNWRFDGGSRVGASLGSRPEPDDGLELTDDWQVAVFGRFVPDEEERVELRAGYQRTWANGAKDRDLVVLGGGWFPAARTQVRGTAWVDIYGSEDVLKQDSVELTRAYVNAVHTFPAGHGLSLSLQEDRFPELRRDEFAPPAEDPFLEDAHRRANLDGWAALDEDVRLSAGVGTWSDEVDSGGSARARVAWSDAFWEGGELSASATAASGRFSTGWGVGLGVAHVSGPTRLRFAWDLLLDDVQGELLADDTLTEHRLRLDLDREVGAHWYLSFGAEQRFGDPDLSSTALRVRLERRD